MQDDRDSSIDEFITAEELAGIVRKRRRPAHFSLIKTIMVVPGSNQVAVNKAGWEHFPHDADIGVRGFGATVAEAFEQAARALTAAITDAPIAPLTSVEVRCEAPDIELLFVEWLNAIIYEMAVRQLLFGDFAVRIEGNRLEGRLLGEPVDVERHSPACEPKGATYTALEVARSQDGDWSAGCVVDV